MITTVDEEDFYPLSFTTVSREITLCFIFLSRG